MRTSTPVIIFSTELVGLNSSQVKNRNDAALTSLTRKGIRFAQGFGSYKGNKESNFVCLIDNQSQINDIKIIAEFFNQESILLVDANQRAVLLNGQVGTRTSLGRLIQVDKARALQEFNYTELNGSYYVTE
jgi:hypothetical protein